MKWFLANKNKSLFLVGITFNCTTSLVPFLSRARIFYLVLAKIFKTKESMNINLSFLWLKIWNT